MKQILIIFFVNCFITIHLHSQDSKITIGARNRALGEASGTLVDSWSVFTNPGAVGKSDISQLSVSYQNRYNIEAFQTVGAASIYTLPWFNLGAGFYRFGDNLFNHQQISLNISHSLQMVSLGLNMSRSQYSIEGLGTKSAFLLEFGGLITLNKYILLSATASNITNSKISSEQKVPVIMTAGISIRPNNSLMMNAEIEKDLAFDENLKVGIEYQIIKWVWIRTGLTTSPVKGSFGFGIKPGKFLIDYAYVNRQGLGDIHELSLSYLLPKK